MGDNDNGPAADREVRHRAQAATNIFLCTAVPETLRRDEMQSQRLENRSIFPRAYP